VCQPVEGHEANWTRSKTGQDQKLDKIKKLNKIMCPGLVEGHESRKPQASDTSAVPHRQIAGDAGKEKKC
jgi:hypothetical protein